MKSRASLLLAFGIAMGVGSALAVALDSWNAGIALGAAMFVVFYFATGRARK